MIVVVDDGLHCVELTRAFSRVILDENAAECTMSSWVEHGRGSHGQIENSGRVAPGRMW
jgi:hypothetical protein